MAKGFYRDLQPEELPVPDRPLMQLIQYTLEEDARVDGLTRLISVNPALTSQLLGLVNSAFFGFRQTIKTISDAVIALGMDSLKNLVLCFAVKEVLSKRDIPGFDIDAFWEDSIRRGIASQQLGRLVNGPVEEAFTAGMLQDIGLLALFSMEPEKADRWPLLRASLPWQRYEMEQELFHCSHDGVGALLARNWNLPESYTRAIGYHHLWFAKKETLPFGPVNNPSVLAGMMHLSDLCNAVYTCHDRSGALAAVKKESKRLFKISNERVNELLALLPGQVRDISDALNLCVGSQMEFETIMGQAGLHLIEENISYQELIWRLQTSLKQRDDYAARLESELDIAREIQKSFQPDIDRIHQVEAFNIPAFHLSGDFYDYFVKKDNTICFCLGDVSGKGTSAALLMAKTISLFRCLCKELDDLGRIVQLMNDELCETAVRGMFVTFVGGWLTPDSNELRLVNMGHLPPFLVNTRGVTKIDPSDPPLGLLPGPLHPAKQLSIKSSRLYLYTDGFTEGRLNQGRTREPGRALGQNGFLRWVLQSSRMSLADQVTWIKEQCDSKLVPQSDDLTLMVLSGE